MDPLIHIQVCDSSGEYRPLKLLLFWLNHASFEQFFRLLPLTWYHILDAGIYLDLWYESELLSHKHAIISPKSNFLQVIL